MDNISVIIRNRNENEYIGFAIQSCLDHFNKPEIIVVDNNSTNDSLQTVNLFKDNTSIKVISVNDYTPGISINLGVKHATRDTILILSAHAQITKVDLELIKLNLTPVGSAVAVFGQQTPIYKGKKISKRYIWSHFKEGHEINMFSEIENRQFLHNAFCFYNKQFLLDNPMPEHYAGKEDRYWAIDMVSKGHSYYYDSTHKANHFYTTKGATWKGIG